MQAGAEDGGPWKWTSEKKWFWPQGSPARDLGHEQEHESYPRFTSLRHLSILELREQVCCLLVRLLGFYTKKLIIYFGKTLSLGSLNLWTLSSWWGWRGAVVEAGSWLRDRAASPGTIQVVATRSTCAFSWGKWTANSVSIRLWGPHSPFSFHSGAPSFCVHSEYSGSSDG